MSAIICGDVIAFSSTRRVERSRGNRIFWSEADEVVAHELVDAHAIRIVNPECAQAGREIIYKVAESAYPLRERSRRIGGQSADDPIDFAAEVVADVGEAEQLELRRSSRAEVS